VALTVQVPATGSSTAGTAASGVIIEPDTCTWASNKFAGTYTATDITGGGTAWVAGDFSFDSTTGSLKSVALASTTYKALTDTKDVTVSYASNPAGTNYGNQVFRVKVYDIACLSEAALTLPTPSAITVLYSTTTAIGGATTYAPTGWSNAYCAKAFYWAYASETGTPSIKSYLTLSNVEKNTAGTLGFSDSIRSTANIAYYNRPQAYSVTLTLMKPDGTEYKTADNTDQITQTYNFQNTNCNDKAAITAATLADMIVINNGGAARTVTWTWSSTQIGCTAVTDALSFTVTADKSATRFTFPTDGSPSFTINT